MYIHLGGDAVIQDSTVIAVFDLDTSTISKHTKAFLRNAGQSNNVITVAEDIPKSFVVCDDNGNKTVYVTQIAASTIYKRLKRKANIHYGFEQL